jgi:putative phage-type endonuclease
MQSTKTMSREEWLEERRKGIGGSDAAAILGMNPYRSPLAVYMDKLGLAPEIPDNEAIRQGRDLEQYVADRFCEATSKKVRRVNRILQHPEYPWMLANIDRDVVGEDAGLECKTTSPYNKTPFDQGDVPAPYYWQCQHYMAVTGAKSWYLAILVHGKAFHTFEISRNDDHILHLIHEEDAFWHYNVLAGVPPLPSGSGGDDELVAMLPTTREADEIADLQDIEDDIVLMQTLKGEADDLDKRINAIKQRIILRLDGAETGRTNRWAVTYKPQTTSRIDTTRLKAERPDIAEEYTKQTTSRVMRVKEVKQ